MKSFLLVAFTAFCLVGCARSDVQVSDLPNGDRVVTLDDNQCVVPSVFEGRILAPVELSEPPYFLVEPSWSDFPDLSVITKRGYFTFFPERGALNTNRSLDFWFEYIPERTLDEGITPKHKLEYRVKNLGICEAREQSDVERLEVVWRGEDSWGNMRCWGLHMLERETPGLVCQGATIQKRLSINFGGRITLGDSCISMIHQLLDYYEGKLIEGEQVKCEKLR